MVAPLAVDVEIVTGVALYIKAQGAQQTPTAAVFGLIIGHNAVQIHGRKTVGDHRLQRLFHLPLALTIAVDAVAHIAKLSGIAHHIGQIGRTHDIFRIVAVKKEEPQRYIVLKFLQIGGQLSFPVGGREIVRGPSRASAYQTVTIFFVVFHYLLCFGRFGHPQYRATGFQGRPLTGNFRQGGAANIQLQSSSKHVVTKLQYGKIAQADQSWQGV